MNDDMVASAAYDDVEPKVRNIPVTDLKDVIAGGLSDFSAHPSHRVFLSLIFPVAGFFMIRMAMDYDVWSLIIPLAAGFALVGPFAAIGMYGLSRRHENHPAVTWRGSMDAFRSASLGSILVLGVILTATFVAWVYSARFIYGFTMASLGPLEAADFVATMFGTSEGWSLLVIGNIVGFIFAVIVLSISVVSFPLLIDHHVSLGTAVRTSIRAVMVNPVTMLVWGAIVGLSLFLGSLPFFVGLAVVFPVLGHATWHLYRKVVEF
jgi:uncharacterized membrane protein